MPTYEFETPTGEILSQVFRMADAPRVGEKLEIDGVMCTRVWETQHLQCAQRHEAFESNTICPNAAKRLGHTNFGPTGSPIFANQKEAREFGKRSEGLYEYGAMPTRSERDAHLEPMNQIAKRQRGRY